MFAATVPGAGGTTVTLSFTQQNIGLAQSVATSISNQVQAGTLFPVDYVGAPLPSPGPGQNLEVVIADGTVPGPVLLSKNATAVVDTAATSVVFGGGGANQEVLSNSTNFQFFTNKGSGTIVTGDGKNQIFETGSTKQSWNISLGGADDLVVINGGTNTVSAGSGSNTIQIAGGDNIINSTGKDYIQALAGSDTITSGPGSDPYIVAVMTDIDYIGGQSAATLLGGQGSDTVFASAGGYFQGGTGGHNDIQNNSGFVGGAPVTILGGGNGDQLFASGSSFADLVAGSGNETLNAALSTANDLLHAGSGKDQLTAGLGNDTLFAGSGKATMTGEGWGTDTFVFQEGPRGRTVTILDFSGSSGDTSEPRRLHGPNEAQKALKERQCYSGWNNVDVEATARRSLSWVSLI
jgi:Ca2+-binding RTX toxin-like protein